MNIIFGNNLETQLDNYTLLELDTFYNPSTGETATAWCVLDQIGLQDFVMLESWKKVHSSLIQCYKDREWDACRSGIDFLKGQWNRELDSFYEILELRIDELENQVLPPEWSGVVIKEF